MKPFLTCALFCFASCLFAQIPKGKIMSEVGLNFQLDQYRYDLTPQYVGFSSTEKTSNFNVLTTNRFFFKENTYLSLLLGYSNSSNGTTNDGEGFNASIGIGALRSLGSKFYIGIDFNIGVGKNFIQYYDNSRRLVFRDQTIEYFANIKPQLYYHIHPKFLIFTGFGQAEYSYSSYYGSLSVRNSFNILLSPRFWNYGFIFLWGKSKEKTTQN